VSTPLDGSVTHPLLLSGVRRQRPDLGAVLGSMLIHAAVLGTIWGAGHAFAPEAPKFTVYRVNIVSPPPQVEGPPTPTPPAPVQPKVTTAETAPLTPKPLPKIPPKSKPTIAPARETPAKAKPTTGRNADAASVGGEGLNVNIEGEEFPEPGYLENIIIQLNRYFRWSGNPNLESCVTFQIRRDGSTQEIRTQRSSGNLGFDLQAKGAVEAAGNRKAFGPLPKGWKYDILPVQFSFSGSRISGCD
jgi:outer membrane biosynthesis protein TonB